MFEFKFCKGHGWCPGEKFSIKHYNNGWHRFFEITVPVKGMELHNYDYYQITYWNNHTDFWGREKTNNDASEPSCVNYNENKKGV
jgi:hypothetical protein